MKEIWKKVPSVPTLEASNKGRIRLAVKMSNSDPKGMILLPTIRQGYKTIRHHVKGKRKKFRVNRLVCEAFNGHHPIDKPLALHDDGKELNNFSSNLYWGDQQQNIRDRDRHGTTSRGEVHTFSKLKEKDIPKIRKMISAGIPQAEIGRKFGVTNYAICDIKRGRSWKHNQAVA